NEFLRRGSKPAAVLVETPLPGRVLACLSSNALSRSSASTWPTTRTSARAIPTSSKTSGPTRSTLSNLSWNSKKSSQSRSPTTRPRRSKRSAKRSTSSNRLSKTSSSDRFHEPTPRRHHGDGHGQSDRIERAGLLARTPRRGQWHRTPHPFRHLRLQG